MSELLFCCLCRVYYLPLQLIAPEHCFMSFCSFSRNVESHLIVISRLGRQFFMLCLYVLSLLGNPSFEDIPPDGAGVYMFRGTNVKFQSILYGCQQSHVQSCIFLQGCFIDSLQYGNRPNIFLTFASLLVLGAN